MSQHYFEKAALKQRGPKLAEYSKERKARQQAEEAEPRRGPGRPKKNPDSQGASAKTSRPPLTIELLESELHSRGISVKLNQITGMLEIGGMDTEEQTRLADNLPVILHSALQSLYKNTSISTITEFTKVIASRHAFNPVLDYLDAIDWDGDDHLAKVYEVLHLADDDWLSRQLILKWIWQGLSLLRNDPRQPYGSDGVLTLAGPQGCGKTTFFRKLSIKPGAWFREGQRLSDFDKDDRRRCVTCWVCELGELDCSLRSDMGMIKGFITNSYDEYRLPYGRTDVQAPRRTNLAATVNGLQFLVDTTGNRRFWTITLTEPIDFDALDALDATQVWKQVDEQYAKGDPQGFRLNQEEQQALAQRNECLEKPIRAEDEIRDILAKAEARDNTVWVWMTVSDFKYFHHDVLGAYSTAQIGAALTRLGIPQDRTKQGRKRRLPRWWGQSDEVDS